MFFENANSLGFWAELEMKNVSLDNLGQNVFDKSTKLTNIGFSMK